jgi:hypothetical protein
LRPLTIRSDGSPPQDILNNNDVVDAFPKHAAMIAHAVHAGMHQTANSDVGTRHRQRRGGFFAEDKAD